jgi:predicted GNAT family acetyltransferase
MATEVRDQPDLHRFEIRVDGELAGFARYQRKGGRIYFVHTEIDPEFEGKGLGSVLARDALDLVRATGEPVVPLCPFIAAFIEHHPDYDDLVDKELLARIEAEPID